MRYFDSRCGAHIAYEGIEFDFKKITHYPLPYKKKLISDVIATFDIESTTLDKEHSWMYHWQMCINGYSIYGRTWTEWIVFIHALTAYLEISPGLNLIIWVHNLGFEFQFIKEICDLEFGKYEIFASQPRKPISVRCGNGIEFRCSYKLSNMSLEKAVKNELGVRYFKASGDLDYDVIRYPDTPLSFKEFGYCMLDTLSLYDYIRNKLRNYGDTLATIPMTSTGYVRRICRNACRCDSTYAVYYKRQEMNENVYKLLKECGRGGDTSSNYKMTGHILKDVDSYDIKSSYPFQMAAKEYPCRKFYSIGRPEGERELLEAIAGVPAIINCQFIGLVLKEGSVCAYISDSKTLSHSKDTETANGRIYFSSWVNMVITDIDYRIIRDSYNYDGIVIDSIYTSKYGLLHEALRNSVLNLFREKCFLEVHKSEGDNAYLYGKKKNEVNGFFGMMYTDPVRDTILYEDNIWRSEKGNIRNLLRSYYDNRNNFLTYAHGVWTTAHARSQLHDLRHLTGEWTAYWDTDSSKGINIDPARIEQANIEIREKYKDLGCTVEVEGQKFYLGTYEHDGHYSEFITLGAKKYAYVDKKGIHITISGVNKEKGARELGSIENFKPGFIFHEGGGNTLFYNDAPLHEFEHNGHIIIGASNISVVESTYKLGLTGEFAEKIGCLEYL